MRHQDYIYIQNSFDGIRNKDILNVSTSSDICLFNQPLINFTGGTNVLTGLTNSNQAIHILSGETQFPVLFQFTGNTNTFTANTPTFKFCIFKYDSNISGFSESPVYSSTSISYSAISGTNSYSTTIPVSDLLLDGEYIVKSFYNFDNCTDFGGRLGLIIDTFDFLTGTSLNIFNNRTDYYFLAMLKADKPIFQNGPNENTLPNGNLFQQIIFPPVNISSFAITNDYAGDPVVTLNGLVLAKNYDYTLLGNLITLSGMTEPGDIVSVIYNKIGINNIMSDSYLVTPTIISGATNMEGNNNWYYNTGTTKYEVYLSQEPVNYSDIILMINGVTLSNGVDYYYSTSNSKRLILNDYLVVGDMVTIVYQAISYVVNGIYSNIVPISWKITNYPQTINGEFTLEVSNNANFSSFISTGLTQYVVNQTFYTDSFIASGTVGTNLYYRVKNNKKFITLSGETINNIQYSDTIKMTIQTNSINSY
jgi:hypothetical protein